jgi:hypothetical protein
MMRTVVSLAAMTVLVIGTAASAQTKAAPKAAAGPSHEESYVDYYYPKPTIVDPPFESKMEMIPGVDRAQRVQFVTVVAQGTLQSNYRVPYAVFTKGDKADRLIVVGLQNGELNTIFRVRALLANMTTMARLSPFFQEHTVAEDATFYDLLKLLGFHDVTVTDGEKFTYQVTIK